MMIQELLDLIDAQLLVNCPILSGNMRSGIAIESIGYNEIVISIDAKYYNLDKWKETGKIEYTGFVDKSGDTGYANIVNAVGAFGKKSKSTHWVNRVCNDACSSIENAEVHNELEL